MLSSLQLAQWRQTGLRFLSDFFGRQHQWPPIGFVQEYYDRNRRWHQQEIEHDPELCSLYYACIAISGSQDIFAHQPQVYHVAFRIPGFFRERWLEFGIVIRYQTSVRLFHINGDHQECTTAETSAPTRFETWFGPGKAVFRVASLHPFSLNLLDPDNKAGERVRFVG